MQLTIAPSERSEWPLAALLVRAEDTDGWADALELLGLTPLSATVYILPGEGAARGCLIVPVPGAFPADSGPFERCQLVENSLFIPERAALSPARAPGELPALLQQRLALLHPETGFLYLNEKVDWSTSMELPSLQRTRFRPPADTVFLPSRVRTYSVHALDEEAALEKLESAFPGQKPMPDKPLSIGEKVKLGLYRLLFRGGAPDPKGERPPAKVTPLGKFFGAVAGKLFGGVAEGAGRILDRMQQNFEDLEKRNGKELDKLMQLLERDPLSALQYAIPLDESGAARGPSDGEFRLFPRWGGWSLFDGPSGRGGGSVNFGGDSFLRLQQQYNRTAQALIEQGAFEKAAFVYMRLLKNYWLAAETLERGGLFAEAASIYLRYCKDKKAAAGAYEKGRMYERALSLYEELNMHGKCGELCRLLGREAEARRYYGKAVEILVQEGRYLQAATMCRQKLGDGQQGEELLLRGWRVGREGEACLRRYCDETIDDALLQRRLVVLCAADVNRITTDSFLQVLRHLFSARPGVSAVARELAYTTVLAGLPADPELSSHLLHFNPGNAQLQKDTMRYRATLRK